MNIESNSAASLIREFQNVAKHEIQTRMRDMIEKAVKEVSEKIIADMVVELGEGLSCYINANTKNYGTEISVIYKFSWKE